MNWPVFLLNNVLLGVGLAMDAFSVSLANGLNDHSMKKHRAFTIAGIFAFFQAAMPLIGWFCVSTLAELFKEFQKFIPWIALLLLCFIGIKMIIDGVKCGGCEECSCGRLSFTALIIQGIATSIDALSVGFTISEYNAWEALLAAFLISLVTFIICSAGVFIGKKAGTGLSGKAGILGGAILIFIGLEIFITGIL